MAGGIQEALRKTRIRTQEELDNQVKVLSMTAQEFTQRSLPYFLASGTLLGIFRDKALIPWDWDVQFYFRTEDAVHRLDEVCEALDKAGVALVRREVRSPTDEFKVVGLCSGVKVEITSWTEAGEFRVRRDSRIPTDIFESTGSIDFAGESFRTFCEIEQYLEWCYGDWRTPIRTSNKSLYLSAQFGKEQKPFLSGLWYRWARRRAQSR